MWNMCKRVSLLSWEKLLKLSASYFFLNECSEPVPWPLGLGKTYYNSIVWFQKYCTQESVSKQTEFLHSQDWFWRSAVFNKGYILSVFVCAERDGSGGDRQWRKNSSEWRRIIEMHLESKLIFSTGQRTGYGNKKRDVIRFSGIWRVLSQGRGRRLL